MCGGDPFTALSVKQLLVLKDPLLVVFYVVCERDTDRHRQAGRQMDRDRQADRDRQTKPQRQKAKQKRKKISQSDKTDR